MKKTYSLKELEAMPTLSQGQFDDLKIETPKMRIWLSRMTKEDGQPYNNQVSIEKLEIYFDKKHNLFTTRWIISKTYQAK